LFIANIAANTAANTAWQDGKRAFKSGESLNTHPISI
jgi:hypothetical protein